MNDDWKIRIEVRFVGDCVAPDDTEISVFVKELDLAEVHQQILLPDILKCLGEGEFVWHNNTLIITKVEDEDSPARRQQFRDELGLEEQ